MAAFASDDEEIFEALEQVSPIPRKSFKRLRIGGSKPVDFSAIPNPLAPAMEKQNTKVAIPVKRARKCRAKSFTEIAIGEKRMSAEEILKSFGKDLDAADNQQSGNESSRKRKTVQRSLLGLVTTTFKNVDSLLTGGTTDPFNVIPNVSDVREVDTEAAGMVQESDINGDFGKGDWTRNELHEQDVTCEHREKGIKDKMQLCENEDSEEGSEEEVDEDDEEAILNSLQRDHKATQDVVEQLPDQFEEKNFLGNGNARAQQGSKKKLKKNGAEDIHVESQRLLRETRGVAFQAMQAAAKPISSVLEKIRLRKLQLTSGLEKKVTAGQKGAFTTLFLSEDAIHIGNINTTGNNNDTLDDEILVIEAEGPVEQQCRNNKQHRQATSNCYPMVERTTKEDQESGCREDVQELQQEADNAPIAAGYRTEHSISDLTSTPNLFQRGSAFCGPVENTQDLFSQSQVSHEENLEELPDEAATEARSFLGSGLLGNLHLDTFTEDEDVENLPDLDSNKENLDPESGKLAMLSRGELHVRALVDDEAEDEDDEDALDDDDGQDDGEDLKDLVVATNEEEKADDEDKRSDLHRKWLEQQDAAMTDDILLRLKTGWVPREPRTRGLDFLNEEDRERSEGNQIDEDQLDTLMDGPDDNLDANCEDSDLLDSDDDERKDENAVLKDTPEMDHVHESDDDEIEQKILRQRFLQESEEQEEFLSPADDETSREVFGLINKVNIVLNKKKPTPGSFEIKGSSSNSNSSSSWGSKSFLRKTSNLSVTVTKQSSSSSISRSFIFGRDDSNSNHSQSNTDSQSEMVQGGKENSSFLQGSVRKVDKSVSNSEKSNASKSSRVSSAGPSLFEILKRQAVDLEEALQRKDKNTVRSNNADGSLFVAFKPLRFGKASHGT